MYNFLGDVSHLGKKLHAKNTIFRGSFSKTLNMAASSAVYIDLTCKRLLLQSYAPVVCLFIIMSAFIIFIIYMHSFPYLYTNEKVQSVFSCYQFYSQIFSTIYKVISSTCDHPLRIKRQYNGQPMLVPNSIKVNETLINERTVYLLACKTSKKWFGAQPSLFAALHEVFYTPGAGCIKSLNYSFNYPKSS